MPTPRPSMAASGRANTGTSTNRATSETSAIAVPMPSTAVRIGMLMATSEPKRASSTMTATARPNPSRPPGPCCSANRTGSPPSSTASRSLSASAAIRLISGTSSLGRLGPRSSNWTTATAIVPSAEIWPRPAYGLSTAVTCSSAATWPYSRSMLRRTAGASTPSEASETIVSRSPASSGKRARSRSNACCDSVPGLRKLLTTSPPATWASRCAPTRVMIHTTTTRRRAR